MPDDQLPSEDERPSKSQRKRDMEALRDLGEHLLTFSREELAKLSSPELIEAVQVCKKITKGNARKRQVSFIGKLLRSELAGEVRAMVEQRDSSTRAHVEKFHQLELWREGLINEEPAAMEEVITAFPDIDRQHLRQLVRSAIEERNEARLPTVAFRKLFQYLKGFVT